MWKDLLVLLRLITKTTAFLYSWAFSLHLVYLILVFLFGATLNTVVIDSADEENVTKV